MRAYPKGQAWKYRLIGNATSVRKPNGPPKLANDLVQCGRPLSLGRRRRSSRNIRRILNPVARRPMSIKRHPFQSNGNLKSNFAIDFGRIYHFPKKTRAASARRLWVNLTGKSSGNNFLRAKLKAK